MLQFPKQFFVTGTDTDVGKTVVSAILTLGLSAYYWKPIQSGAPHDSEFLARAGVPAQNILPERFRLTRPLSPHLSARLDNVQIILEDFNLPKSATNERLVVEGAGGLLVPFNDQHKVVDLIKHLALPVVLVARSALGTINHTLLSLEALRAREVEIFGVIMTGEPNLENRLAIEKFGSVRVLGEVPILPSFDRETLINCFQDSFEKGARRDGDNN